MTVSAVSTFTTYLCPVSIFINYFIIIIIINVIVIILIIIIIIEVKTSLVEF